MEAKPPTNDTYTFFVLDKLPKVALGILPCLFLQPAPFFVTYIFLHLCLAMKALASRNETKNVTSARPPNPPPPTPPLSPSTPSSPTHGFGTFLHVVPPSHCTFPSANPLINNSCCHCGLNAISDPPTGTSHFISALRLL